MGFFYMTLGPNIKKNTRLYFLQQQQQISVCVGGGGGGFFFWGLQKSDFIKKFIKKKKGDKFFIARI